MALTANVLLGFLCVETSSIIPDTPGDQIRAVQGRLPDKTRRAFVSTIMSVKDLSLDFALSGMEGLH
ncbi:unnamed protein product [Menidia menidia]|uniref:(Atlantic silverside) hypothetical protein n=1 Tax=Menidia menidia TaxID=238744 RepID=A0A8S4ABE6_9TELE|nr:unnamed protein product [Menidia menidia]